MNAFYSQLKLLLFFANIEKYVKQKCTLSKRLHVLADIAISYSIVGWRQFVEIERVFVLQKHLVRLNFTLGLHLSLCLGDIFIL